MTSPNGELVISEPAADDRVVPLDAGTITIGRDRECRVVLSSPFVGRRHATIELGDEGPMFLDHGSRNGSLVNGARVFGSLRLRGGDVITIASTTILFQAAEEDTKTTETLRPAVLAGVLKRDGTLNVDRKTFTVYVDGLKLERPLSAQEFQLVNHLYEHRDRVCTREELGDLVWGANNWDKNMLHRLVHRLKMKLEPGQATSRYVQTLPWLGYRLTP